jgi:hypothetical protein
LTLWDHFGLCVWNCSPCFNFVFFLKFSFFIFRFFFILVPPIIFCFHSSDVWRHLLSVIKLISLSSPISFQHFLELKIRSNFGSLKCNWQNVTLFSCSFLTRAKMAYSNWLFKDWPWLTNLIKNYSIFLNRKNSFKNNQIQ